MSIITRFYDIFQMREGSPNEPMYNMMRNCIAMTTDSRWQFYLGPAVEGASSVDRIDII